MTKLPEALRKKLEAKSKEYAAGLIQPPVARFDFMQGAQECHELLEPLIKEAREHREGLQRDNRCLEEALCNQGIDAGYAEEKLNKEITALKASLKTAAAALEELAQGYDSPFSDDIAREALEKIRKDRGVTVPHKSVESFIEEDKDTENHSPQVASNRPYSPAQIKPTPQPTSGATIGNSFSKKQEPEIIKKAHSYDELKKRLKEFFE